MTSNRLIAIAMATIVALTMFSGVTAASTTTLDCDDDQSGTMGLMDDDYDDGGGGGGFGDDPINCNQPTVTYCYDNGGSSC